MIHASCRLAKHLLISLGLVALLVSCASYTDRTHEIRSDYFSGRYEDALRKLEESGLNQESSSELLYYLEKAMILDRQGQRDKARKLLLTADRVVERLFTTSVVNTAASFVVNDSAQDYSGEDYEKVAIHTMLALSFLQDNDLQAAGVEARKINNLLHSITADYDQRYNSYSEDAFARYLAGLIYEARGEFDDAIIDYRTALKLYSARGYQRFYRGSVPASLVKGLYGLALKRKRSSLQEELERAYPDLCSAYKRQIAAHGDELAQIVVLHEMGKIAVKRTHEFIIPIDRQVVRFSFPYIPSPQHISYAPTGFELEAQGFIYADNVADLNAIAHYSLEDRRGRMLLKSAARLLAKAQLTEQARKNLGPLGGLAANAYALVTETADTRSWTLLPEAFYVSREWVKAGTHQIKIKNNGRLSEINTLQLAPGKLALLRDR